MKLFKFFVIENFMVVSIPLCETSSELFPDLFERFNRLHPRSATLSCTQPFGDSFDRMINALDRMIHSFDGMNHSLDRSIHSLDKMIHSTAFRKSFKAPSPQSFTPSKLTLQTTGFAPPMAKEVNGIERAEDDWKKPNPGEIGDGGNSTMFPSVCQCSNGTWENIDTNDGTGDHESFKLVLNQLSMILPLFKISLNLFIAGQAQPVLKFA